MSDALDFDVARERITALMDDDATLCGFVWTGKDSGVHYYLATTRDRYEGNEMLRVRYAALADEEWRDDTWLKNGISIRLTDGIEGPLAALLVGSINGNDDPAALYDEV